MYANKIATLKRELEELDRRSQEVDAKMKTADRACSNAKRRIGILTHYQADTPKIDDATIELENRMYSYANLNSNSGRF